MLSGFVGNEARCLRGVLATGCYIDFILYELLKGL